MNIRSIIILVVGVLSVAVLIISLVYRSFNTQMNSISGLAAVFSLAGLFLGIWFIVGLGFREYRLTLTSTIVLFLSTLINTLVFAISDFGQMLTFWLPVALVTVVGIKSSIHALLSISNQLSLVLRTKASSFEQKINGQKHP